ncbi:MAG TPA: sigma-70 family RNA polymerase sigma factor [Streptosporangiaceae bacterium]|nr:sigma-70 family RNA polymerase sigma factor [Streptosporangiaceae bacterium]
MRDSEVVAAIVAGNPEGLAEAYDRYASPLYTYCRSLLREPADAADAVQDTFVIAASRLAELRDRNRLRPWLYAVARNECHRRLRARTVQVATPLDEMPDVTDTSADVSGEAERDELRTLLRSAVRGLNSGEQDLIELQLRQGLDAAEIAAVLGVSRNHAHALLSRARDQLEISLGALLVARSGRDDCAGLNTMLSDWDGQLNVLMRKRINRHIENCPVCAERKKRELAPALLLGLAPLAAAVPPGLREQVLRLASSNTPDAAAHRASVAQRTAPFGHHGFPKPLDPPKSSWWRTRSGQAAAAAAAAAAVAALTLLAVALASSGPGHPGGGAAALGPGAGPGTSIAAASGTAGGPGSGAPGSGGSGGRSSNHPQPTVSANGSANVSPAPGAGGAPAPGGGSSAPPGGGSATSSGAPGHSGHPSPPTSAPASSSSAKPSSPAPATSSATATASSSPTRGILTVTPTTILLGLNGGTLTLKASFGSVNWSIAESSSLVGRVTVSPTAGTLASGQSTTVSLSAGSALGGLHEAALADGGGGVGACAACTLTVNPGNITVTVVLEISVGNSSSPPPSSPPPSSPPPDDVRPAALVGRLVN